MKIADSIIKLLLEDNEVSISGLGVFKSEFVNSSIHPITKEVTPPHKKVIFTRFEQKNSNRFAQVFANENSLSISDAEANIQEFVQKINSELINYRKTAIEGFATIKMNVDDSYDVIMAENVIFDKDYYALPSFQIKNTPTVSIMEENNINSNPIENQPIESPSETSVQQPIVEEPNQTIPLSETKPPKKKKTWLWILIIIIILAGIGVSGYMFMDKIMEITGIGKPKTEVTVEKKDTVITETVEVIEEVIDTVTQITEEVTVVEEVKPEVVKTTKNTNSGSTNNYVKPVDLSKLVYAPKGGGKYYVIAGSFKVIENAATLVAQLTKQGYNPVVIEKNEQGLIRVAYKPGFDTERLARDFADDLYENKNLLPWIVQF